MKLRTEHDFERLSKTYNLNVYIDKTKPFPADAFKTHIDSRAKTLQIFSHIKVGEKSLLEIIASNKELQRQALAIFESDFTTPLSTFNEESSEFNEQRDKQDFSRLVSKMHATVNDATSSIINQDKAELKRTEDLLPLLKVALAGKTDEECEAVKNQMIKALEDSHKSQLDPFTDTTRDYLTTVQNNCAREKLKLFHLASWYENNAKAREAMEEQARKNRNEGTRVLEEEAQIDFSKINIDELLKTLGMGIEGNQITIDSKTHGILGGALKSLGVFGDVLDFSYTKIRNFCSDDPMMGDIYKLAVIAMLKHDGNTTFTVDFDDPKEAKRHAKLVYEACVLLGRDPSTFTIVMAKQNQTFKAEPNKKNKNEQTFETGLFGDASHELKVIEDNAKKIKPILEKQGVIPVDYKKDLSDIKNSQAEPEKKIELKV